MLATTQPISDFALELAKLDESATIC